MVNSPEPSG